MDKILKTNLIVAASVVAVPAVVATYLNVRMHFDVKRINKANDELRQKMNETIDNIRSGNL